jgi:hypothetical protein
MTYYEFSTASTSYQVALILTDGLTLAQRHENAFHVTLYYMPDNFFVELYRDTRSTELAKMYCFKHSAPLERYVSHLKIPAWLD